MVKIPPIVVGAAGAVVFVAVVVGFFWFYKSCKSISNSTSETGSSDPSALSKVFQFSESNLIGYGIFGPVYKGLLRDIVVAIKRHPGAPRPEFVAGASSHSSVVCADTGRDAPTRLEFKQRLSIALGAARGLCHLHGLKPPLIHKNFKTANVLVDEDFIAKVADAGVSELLEKIEEAGPSYTSSANIFRDPEVEVSGSFTESSDVYSFGVFLLELVTGQEQAVHMNYLGSNESLIQWVQSRLSSNDFVDHRLVGSFTMDGIRDLIKLTLKCMSFPGKRRPDMTIVSVELERIHEKEMEMTTVRGEGTAKITLGSELFASK
ncbi:hypothetical protein V6N13_013738 [Hibiscus sabdariffa]